jgi:hypothetical protein
LLRLHACCRAAKGSRHAMRPRMYFVLILRSDHSLRIFAALQIKISFDAGDIYHRGSSNSS